MVLSNQLTLSKTAYTNPVPLSVVTEHTQWSDDTYSKVANTFEDTSTYSTEIDCRYNDTADI